MIQEIDWYSKHVGNTFFSDIHFRVHYGRNYKLSFNGAEGYVIYADQEIKRSEKAAHAMLGEIQLFLKKEGSFLKPVFKVYDYKTNLCIGNLKTKGFILSQQQYNIRILKRSIFIRNEPCDLRLEVDNSDASLLVAMNIDRVDKKWYREVYYQNLTGTVEFESDISQEIILCCFFYLHNYIQQYNRS